MKNFLILTLTLLLSSHVIAGGWTGTVKIKNLLLVEETKLLISLSNFNNPDDCYKDDGHLKNTGHIVIDPSAKNAAYTLILSAYISQKEVDFFVHDCTGIWANTAYANFGHIKTF